MDNDIRSRFRGIDSRPSRPASEVPSRPQPALRPAPSPKPTPGPQPAPPQPHPDPAPAVAPPKKKSKGRVKRVLGALLTLIILGGLGAGGFFFYQNRKPGANNEANQQPTENQAQPAAEQPTGTIRLIATGDFSAYDSINETAKNGNNYDYLPMMGSLKPVLDKADINICSQASPAGGDSFGISGYPTFNAPFGWSKGLEDVGCNIINIGSGHTNDKGQAAIDAFVKNWEERKDMLAIAGANRSADGQKKINYFTVKNVKFAYLSYVEKSRKPLTKPYGVNIYSESLAKKQIEEARKNAQFVIVSISWGREDSAGVTPEQNQIAKVLAGANADLVIGNGSHIVQPAKVLNGKEGHQTLVWFSLGNALNSQLPSENLFGCFAVINIDVATQNVTNPGCLPVYMHYEWSAAEKASGRLEARRNFKLLVLDQAEKELAKSQNNTTVKDQTKRLKDILTKESLPIKMITFKDL